MSKRYSQDDLAAMLRTVTERHGSRVYRHIESGTLYLVLAAVWSTDLQAPALLYCPLGHPGVVFSRDFRVFDGEKFERVDVAHVATLQGQLAAEREGRDYGC